MTEALARAADPATSKAAADALNRRGLNELETAVVRALHFDRNNGGDGLTVTEIARFSDHDRDSISPRMKGLAKDGFVVDTGRTRIPPGKSKAQRVWALPAVAG